MSEGLPVSDVVNVNVNLAPVAAGTRNFGSLLLLGVSSVIAPGEPLREYHTLSDVAGDFGVNDPEYEAAQLFFDQSPKPNTLYIGRWAKTASNARLNGGVLSATEQNIANFNTITTGSLDISVDGTAQTLTGINLSSDTSLNGVAATIEASLTGATVLWNANIGRFEITSSTTGTTSTISYATVPATGTDLGALLKLESGQASTPINGIAAQSLDQTVQDVANQSTAWYGLSIAASATDDEIVNTAGVIEGQTVSRIFGVTTTDSTVFDPASTTDIGYRLSNHGYARTAWQYSSNPYAVVSAMARAFTVNFRGQNTTITLKFKQEPNVTPETLTVTQANTIDQKNGNVFVNYNNSTSILQQGVMSNGDYFDERHGLDWLQNYIETNAYNLLYTSQTKIPQTDAGVSKISTNVERSCAQAVTNGLLAPGIWRSSVEFGSLQTGDTLPKGYYVYAPSVASQSAADRAARKSPVLQVAAKLAGAIHSVDVVVNVNR